METGHTTTSPGCTENSAWARRTPGRSGLPFLCRNPRGWEPPQWKAAVQAAGAVQPEPRCLLHRVVAGERGG